LRQTSTVVFCAVDAFLPIHGKAQSGFDEFCVDLERSGVPAVWVTNRSRAQMDEPLRRLGHRHPFIAERGSGVYLPEGYFNLRAAKAMRLGRFTCIPIAEPLPAASQALESLSEETGVSVVAFNSLSPRELVQNLGLPAREAEWARQRDFDEPFFFAGASDADVERFAARARLRKLSLRHHGMLWSLSVGGCVGRAIRQLSKLYERALHLRPTTVAITIQEEAEELLSACDRSVLLVSRPAARAARTAKGQKYALSDPRTWDSILAEITSR
jgi:mannosyl-3-phosphoglycerate phosphatase